MKAAAKVNLHLLPHQVRAIVRKREGSIASERGGESFNIN
jgi:hypothetical protein